MRKSCFRPLYALLTALSIAAMAYQSTPARAAETVHLRFVTHAAFFSGEMHLGQAIDPQMFVRDRKAPAGIGPQKIRHVAGIRNLRFSDASSTPLFSAAGKRLGFTAGRWLGAHGVVTIAAAANGANIVATFSGLKPHGVYSLFENHFDVKPVGFTPLDGDGKHNSFTAGAAGDATVRIHSPRMLTHANAVLLVYHSDGKTHGRVRGQIGINRLLKNSLSLRGRVGVREENWRKSLIFDPLILSFSLGEKGRIPFSATC